MPKRLGLFLHNTVGVLDRREPFQVLPRKHHRMMHFVARLRDHLQRLIERFAQLCGAAFPLGQFVL